MVSCCKMWFLITTTLDVVGRKKLYISLLTLPVATDNFVASPYKRAPGPSPAVARNREVGERTPTLCRLQASSVSQGVCMDSDEHQTEELGSLVSHGIEDHYPKFWENPLSYFIYMHLLFYAKHSGPEKGRYIFETREIASLMCFGRDETHENPSLHRGTVIKAIKHLAKIGMIKILQKPTGKYNRLWKVEIAKYKTAWGDFRALFKAESPKSHVANSQPDSPTVASPQPDEDYTKSCVASSRQKTPEQPNLITPLSQKQTEMFDTKHGTQEDTEDDSSLSSVRDGRKIHNFSNDQLLVLQNPIIPLSFEILCGSIYNNIYSLFSSKREKHTKEVNMLLVLLEKGGLDDLSSEELIKPDDAIAITNELHRLTKDPKFDSKRFGHIDSVARGEFLRLYWNHIRHNGEMPFQRVKVIGAKRQEKLKKAFDNSNYFRESWAHALLRIRDSKHCRGETARRWKANLDWFIRDETTVIGAMEGKYDDRGDPAGRIRRSFDEGTRKKEYLKGVPLSMVQSKDIPEWRKANPKAAREAAKQGLL